MNEFSLISMLRRLMPVVAGMCLLAICAAAQGQKISLRVNASPGQVWTFDQSMDMSMNQQATSNGQTQSVDSKMHRHRVGKCEVLAVQNGAPTQMRITYGNDCDTSMQATGQAAQKPAFPLAGQTVVVTQQADGSVKTDFRGELDPGTLTELQQMLEPDNSIYPDHAVAVGEEWAGNPRAVAKQFQLQGNDTAGMTLKLLSIKQINGRPVAEVKVSAAVDTQPQGGKMEMIMQGVALVDMGTGAPLKIDLKGNITQNGSGSAAGPNGQMQTYTLQGKGTIVALSTCDLVADGAAAAPAPVASGGGGNPLAPAAAGPDYSGKYTDGTLTLELQGSGPFTGTITRGPQIFQASASLKNGHLEGTFQAGGQSFPFTATLNGDTLTFKSDTATFTLKKQVANPLVQPAPRNPLEGAAAPTPKPVAAAPTGASTMRFVTYVLKDDPNYIGGEVSRALIPAGWKVDGGMEWDLSTALCAQAHTMVYNPQGVESFGFYPSLYYYWSTNQIIPQMAPGSNYAGSIIRQPVDSVFTGITQLIVPRYRTDLKNARVVERQELPKLAAATLQQMPPVAGTQNDARAGRVRFEYQINGQSVEEDVYAVMAGSSCPQLQFTSWYLMQIMSIRAPKGKLAEVKALQEVVERTLQPNIQWYNKYTEFMDARHNIAMDAIQQAGVRSRIVSQLSNDISDITRQSYENQQKTNDQISEARSEYMRDLTPYDDGGKRVVLPNNYQHAWSSGDGQYILSNDPNYDPNQDLNTHSSWTKMSEAAR